MISRVLAQSTVTELESAENWYGRLFGCAPDARPMPGLLEWHLGEGFGVQVWSEPDRARHSTIVLDETNLDGAAARLVSEGIDHEGPQEGGGARVLQLLDPDGNRVVLSGI
jgi:catechol 2,3-dioxygenase-like lactoylglutathione lyase family enzyme